MIPAHVPHLALHGSVISRIYPGQRKARVIASYDPSLVDVRATYLRMVEHVAKGGHHANVAIVPR